MDKKTPLYNWHNSNGGKMVPFGGYLLPVQYETGLITEHMAVREKAGLFDVSHMGEFLIKGKDALTALQWLFTNDFSNMTTGRVRYTLMCNNEGGILDDLLVFKLEEDQYLLVVNASNQEKDAEWIIQQLNEKSKLDAEFTDASDSYALIALQGPLSEKILGMISGDIPQKYYTFLPNCKVQHSGAEHDNAGHEGFSCLISRTGYTGEDGFEIYCDPKDALPLWEALLNAGKEYGLIPCGLGARDTLRLEAAMPLYGHEMNEEINPFEADLAFAVKMDKGEFIGKAAMESWLKEKKESGQSRIRTGIKVTGRGIIREDSPVFYEGEEIGITTSGTFCPYLKTAYAMALIKDEFNIPGTRIEAKVRDRIIEAEITKLPFYKR